MKKPILVLAMIAFLALMGIVMATSSMNPRITYTGKGLPDSSVGRVGDLYIDMDTNILYVFSENNTWRMFAVLPNPVNGTDGLNGATWIVGTMDPASDLGRDGDFYFNSGTLSIFYRLDGTWELLANITPIQGPQGEPGPQGLAGTDGINGTNGIDGKDGLNGTNGRNGSTWYNELVAPMKADLGFDGDYYMFANGTVYYKTGETWVYFTSLMGVQGAPGPQGQPGADGLNGTNGTNGTDGKDGINGTAGPEGPAGPRGETGPQGPVGPQGETGLSGSTGPQGTSGVNGIDGTDGATGADGSDAPWWVYIILSAVGGGAVGSTTVILAKRKSQS